MEGRPSQTVQGPSLNYSGKPRGGGSSKNPPGFAGTLTSSEFSVSPADYFLNPRYIMASLNVPRGVKPMAGRSYAIRLSYPADSIHIDAWTAMLDLCEAIFATSHNDTNTPHVHIALFNSKVSHDTLRKKLIEIVKNCIEPNPPKGNALMSVKQWNCADKYLIYMLKGNRHAVAHNVTRDDEGVDEFAVMEQFNENEVAYLRAQWRENESTASIEYKEWMDSVLKPIPITITRTVEEMLADVDGWLTKTEQPPFDTIKRKALEFSMAYLRVPALDSKVKHMAKNLISNYCWFNNITMKPYHI